MRFKKDAIKPGMVIHCPKEEDAKDLLWHLNDLGYAWGVRRDSLFYEEGVIKTRREDGDCYCLYGDEKGRYITVDTQEYFAETEHCIITEFSDLIEPDDYDIDITDGKIRYGGNLSQLNNLIDDSPVNSDTDSPMSAVEVLRWLRRADGDTKLKLFESATVADIFFFYTPEQIVRKITAYEAAKKAPKPVEVEWVDVCRIIQIQDNGFKKCVYEEELPDNDGYATTENILKKYISEHEGQYIAVIEGICRVKEDK